MIDNLTTLTTCPKCKVQDSCYIVPVNEFHNSYTCFNCGFQTNDLMREGEFNFEEYENEILLIDVMLELVNKDNHIYLTNILPPNFILDCKHYYKNIKFGIIKLEEEELKTQIKKRHNPNYNSNYIIEKNNKLKTIIDKKSTFKTFKNFKEFKEYFEPSLIGTKSMIQRIIRL